MGRGPGRRCCLSSPHVISIPFRVSTDPGLILPPRVLYLQLSWTSGGWFGNIVSWWVPDCSWSFGGGGRIQDVTEVSQVCFSYGLVRFQSAGTFYPYYDVFLFKKMKADTLTGSLGNKNADKRTGEWGQKEGRVRPSPKSTRVSFWVRKQSWQKNNA